MATNSQTSTLAAPRICSRRRCRRGRSLRRSPGGSASYGCPSSRFHAQHPVRGFFGDPRLAHERAHGSFHFGVDVAPDGTPVYATLTGTTTDPANAGVRRTGPLRRRTTTCCSLTGMSFAACATAFAVAYNIVIGWISQKIGSMLRFAEVRDGRYVNPLRAEGVRVVPRPYDTAVHMFGIERDGTPWAAASGTPRRSPSR